MVKRPDLSGVTRRHASACGSSPESGQPLDAGYSQNGHPLLLIIVLSALCWTTLITAALRGIGRRLLGEDTAILSSLKSALGHIKSGILNQFGAFSFEIMAPSYPTERAPFLDEENDQSPDELSQDEIRAILETIKRGYSSDPEIRALAIEKAAHHLRKLEATEVWRVEKLPPHSMNQPAAGGEISIEGFGPGAVNEGWIHRRR